MRGITSFVIVGLAMGAAACSTHAPAPTAPIAAASSGAPEPVADYDWHLSFDGDDAKLAYGLAESDDLRLALACKRGAGQLEIMTVSPAAARSIVLESGGETETFPAKSEPAELHEGIFLTAQSAAQVPVFQRFRKVGWMAGWRETRRETYVPHPATAPDIEQFFAFCG